MLFTYLCLGLARDLFQSGYSQKPYIYLHSHACHVLRLLNPTLCVTSVTLSESYQSLYG